MTTENTSVVQDELDKTGAQVDPKESDATGVDPQGTQKQGENEQETKRKGGWQRKIEKLERQNEYLMNQVLGAPKTTPEPKVQPKPKPSWTEYEAAGKQEQFFEDMADWKADEKLRAYKEEQKAQVEADTKKRETQTEQEKIAERWNKDTAEFRKENPDFDDAIASANPSELLSNLVARSKEPAKLAYYLANNPDVEASLSRMTDAGEVREELGLIRAQLAQPATEADDEADVQAAPAQAKPLPKPPTPIQKSSSVSKRFDPLDPSSYGNDFTAYEKHMNERDKRKAKG